jgi:hypothetical protein
LSEKQSFVSAGLEWLIAKTHGGAVGEVMGAFFTNLQVRNASTQAICAALPKLTQSRVYVSPESNGWVTVYAEATEDQNEQTLCVLAGGLSRTLKTDVFSFLVHDSDIAIYWLYRSGVLTDEFNCAPDYFGERLDEKTRARVRGNTDALLPLCVGGVTRAQLDEILHPADGPPTMAEDIVIELAKLLGIDAARASLGFNYFNEEGEEMLPDAAEFEGVGEGTERKEVQPTSNIFAVDFGGTALPDDVPPAPLLDAFPIAINMLTQTWNSKYDQTNPQFIKMFGNQTEGMMKQMRDAFDKSTRDLLKQSTVPGLPKIEELKAARDQGPEALAALIAERTPGQITEIGVGAAVYGLESFLGALLKHGLDPNAANAQGRTTLNAAEQHGKESDIYRLAKAAAKGK